MNEKQLIRLREQLQEDLICWREGNDLPDHQDEVLCDIVLNAFIDAAGVQTSSRSGTQALATGTGAPIIRE